MNLLLAMMILVERSIGVRDKGVLLVFGQTAMFFYLVHRLLLESSATWLGWRGFGDLGMTLLLSLVILVLLYPTCLWYRGHKARHPDSRWLRYL